MRNKSLSLLNRQFYSDDLRRVKNLDRDVLNDLLAKWRPLLKLYAQGRVRSVHSRVDSSDVVQDTMVYLAANLHLFRGTSEGEFVAWAKATLLSSASYARRFHTAHRRSVDCSAPLDSTAIACRDDVDQGLLEAERMLHLAACVDLLSPALQDVVVRRIVHAQDYQQIAEATGQAESTVRGNWKRAVAKLQEFLGERVG